MTRQKEMRKLKLDELGRMSAEELKKAPKNPVVLLLDNIRSLSNIGSAFRTADAFRIEKIILAGISGVPPHREINRTALGATESVTWVYEKDATKAVRQLKQDGYTIICIEQTTQSVPLDEFIPENKTPICLVFGNEVSGVTHTVLDEAHYILEIPQQGTKHSFNVSVSIGIVMWDIFQKMKL